MARDGVDGGRAVSWRKASWELAARCVAWGLGEVRFIGGGAISVG